jgi:hypothetical protein
MRGCSCRRHHHEAGSSGQFWVPRSWRLAATYSAPGLWEVIHVCGFVDVVLRIGSVSAIRPRAMLSINQLV